MTRGLLGRMAATNVADARRADVVDSVLEHLRALLNARRGGARTRDDFGIPDFTDTMHALPHGTAELCEALRETIEAYEPRLSHVRVRPGGQQEPGCLLRFEITARLVTEERRALRFSTLFRPGGRIEVA